jgi:hypothetical protein
MSSSPTLREVVNDKLVALLLNWKTTVQAFLGIGMTAVTALLADGKLSPKHSLYLICVQSILKGWIGLTQKDAKQPSQ